MKIIGCPISSFRVIFEIFEKIRKKNPSQAFLFQQSLRLDYGFRTGIWVHSTVKRRVKKFQEKSALLDIQVCWNWDSTMALSGTGGLGLLKIC